MRIAVFLASLGMATVCCAEEPLTIYPKHDVFTKPIIRSLPEVKKRLDAGLDPNTCNSTRTNRDTLLAYAVRNGTPDTVRLIIQAGGEVNAKSYFFEKTPLFQAAFDGRIDVAQVLIAAKADVNAVDVNSNNVLREAIFGGGPLMVRYLLQQGVNPLQRNNDGKTMKDLAIDEGSRNVRAIFEPPTEVESSHEPVGDPRLSALAYLLWPTPTRPAIQLLGEEFRLSSDEFRRIARRIYQLAR